MKTWAKNNAIQLIGAVLVAAAFWVTVQIQSSLKDYLPRAEADKRASIRDEQMNSIAKKQEAMNIDLSIIRFQTGEMYQFFVKQRQGVASSSVSP